MSGSVQERLAADIAQIRIVDGHSHIFPLPYEQMPDNVLGAAPFDYPVMLRVDNPHWLGAWKRLYGYVGDSMAPEDARVAYDRKQSLRQELGPQYAAWILDRLGVQAALVNMPMMAPGQAPPRFFRVAHMDAFLYPFGLPPEIETKGLLSLVLRRPEEAAAPAMLAAYLDGVVLPQLKAVKEEGAVAVKFTTAYLRPLSFEKVAIDEASEIYQRGAGGPVLPAADQRKLEDFLFRFVTREAGSIGLVVQIHTGVGADPRWNVSGSNPLLLESLVDDAEQLGTNFVLIHGGWPFSEQAGVMLIKPNVYGDLSDHTFLRSSRAVSKTLRSWLEWYPEKVMYGSDAYPDPGTPLSDWEEKAWLTSTSFRNALVIALGEMMNDGQIDYDRALELADMTLRTNAIRLYGLGDRLS